MVIFAWVLWGLYILGYTICLALVVCSVIAINDSREVSIKINPITSLFNIAVFVFLNLYLFA